MCYTKKKQNRMVVLFLVRMYPTHGRQPGGKILICCCLFHTKVVSEPLVLLMDSKICCKGTKKF